MKLGFIGTGALTAAIVTGLESTSHDIDSILVSPRNAAISADLASRYRDVTVAADNQAVLDGCDMVMLAVRPQVARDVIAPLQFRPDHHVVSLIAAVSLEDITALVEPARQVTRALPMPMAAQRQGATIVYPADPRVTALFGTLGTVVEAADPAEFDILGATSATYASYFKYLDTLHRWAVAQGASGTRAREYIVALFKALAQAPDTRPDMDFTHLAADYSTAGGLNEQLLRELTVGDVFDKLETGLDNVHRRIIGK